jgi:hypothetical protein
MSTSFSVASCTEQMTLPFLDNQLLPTFEQVVLGDNKIGREFTQD